MNELQIAQDHTEGLGMPAWAVKSDEYEQQRKRRHKEWEWRCNNAQRRVEREINDLCDSLPYLPNIVAYIQKIKCVPSLRDLEQTVWDRSITREAFRRLVRHLRQATVRNVDAARRSVDWHIEIDQIIAQHSAK